MNSKVWRSKALSMCLVVTVIATYSMVALANTDKVAGELSVYGKNINGVTVNGEAAQNGRSIFSSSVIATPENTSASVNVGTVGTVKLDPNSSIALTFDANGISAELLSGQLTVLNAANAVSVKLLDGTVVQLNSGDSATAEGAKAQDDDDDDDPGSGAWFIWALLLGGAAAGIIIAATSNNNDLDLGGGTTVVSPTR